MRKLKLVSGKSRGEDLGHLNDRMRDQARRRGPAHWAQLHVAGDRREPFGIMQAPRSLRILSLVGLGR